MNNNGDNNKKLKMWQGLFEIMGGNIPRVKFLGKNLPGGSLIGGKCSWWEFSGWEFS